MQVKGSDCLDYDVALVKGMALIESGKNPNLGLLIVCGINMGLRISDLLTIEYGQLKSGRFILKEKKTDKGRKIMVNSNVVNAVSMMPETAVKNLGGKVFISNKGSVYSQQHVNRMLKDVFPKEEDKISSHSLRKTFGKRFYEKMGEGSLSKLQKQFNHVTPDVTLNYIGITQDGLDDMYEDIV